MTKKGLDNKVKADKNKVRSKIFLFLTALFQIKKERQVIACLYPF
ncbi:hypothetical protein [Haemophilus parainfluenzae]|nr:hypothetical protein [Haemophilus parainfluenzae]